MDNPLKTTARAALRRLGYRLMPLEKVNRFQAMGEALHLLRRLGFHPRLIIDAGAHVGDWARLASGVWPQARVELIEPQVWCAPQLSALARTTPGWAFHAAAVTEPSVKEVRMTGEAGTGFHVAIGATDPDSVAYAATTLDDLFASRVVPDDRTLLKLDLEGHEMPALRGGRGLLRVVEAVLTECQFFSIGQDGQPVFGDLLALLRQEGFELFDFACLAGRRRDGRLIQGDAVFVRRGSPLLVDRSWD